ncbi:MAG: NAD(+) diphosphatase [Deltaproteobacteria bacterium]|nr:NAD(+) diphosphatase [Deltaproteobacteria bacterium]
MSPNRKKSQPSIWFVFHKGRLLVKKSDEKIIILHPDPPAELGLSPYFSRYIGNYGGSDIYAAEISPSTTPPATLQFLKLRSLFEKMDGEIFALAGRAIQIIHWNRDHLFCGRCGSKMRVREKELAKICPSCSFTSFPRLSPAVIMSVIRENEILLARSPRFPPGMYSTLAGFVEPGETLEETVAREVQEEVGIEVSSISYLGSQPWPFPHSLMVGFSTRHAHGEIRIDNDEIEDAQWFTVNNLPLLPTRISIARHLIELFIDSAGKI